MIPLGTVFLPLLPLKNTVLYPFLLSPLLVNSARSKRVIEHVLVTPERLMLAVAVNKELDGSPGPDDVHRTGTVVRVVKMVSVNDCGLPVNPLTTQNQVIGAMIQGASWALFENRLLDRNVGTMLNPNLEWYKILAPADMFEAQSILTPVANLGNNTSTAGIGEPPIVPTLAVIANAVYNAIGVRIRELPITPDRVLAALSEAKRRA